MINENLVAFLDQVGRTIFGEKVTDPDVLGARINNKNILVIKNPVVVHISQKPTGEMALQLLPIFFKEFLENKDEDVNFTYNLDSITLIDVVNFDSKLHANYRGMFSNIVVPDDSTIPSGKGVIKLFDEKG